MEESKVSKEDADKLRNERYENTINWFKNIFKGE